MLISAYKYQNELNELLMNSWYEDKYKFYHDNWHERIKVDEGDWNKREFVSIDTNGKVLGFIAYNIDRVNDYVSGLSFINFSDNKITFGKDVHKAFTDIFEKYNFRKIKFSVTIGNPIEKQYDKLIHQYGGRIVGIYKEHVKLIDNKYYDVKYYEIFQRDYFINKKGDTHESN